MSHKRSCFVFSLLVAATLSLSSGCHGPDHDQTARQLHESHMERSKAQYGKHLDDMADNAILSDMSLADFHFVPHSSEISGTGAARLNRMAHLLNSYGGTVRYETDMTDADLVNRRMANVKEYLTVAGTNMDRVQVKAMLSGGRGMSAQKAIEVEAKGTVDPNASSGAGATLAVPAMPQGR